MINPNSTRFQIEQNEFYSDKCPHCMSYIDENDNCNNNFCNSKIPEGYSYNQFDGNKGWIMPESYKAVLNSLSKK